MSVNSLSRDDTRRGLHARPARSLVMLVDASEAVRVVMATVLDGHYDTVMVANGREALNHLTSAREVPDVILLDMQVAGPGLDLIRRLQSNIRTRDVPVIMLANSDEVFSGEQILQAGAADFVVKPIQPAVLLARLRTQIDNQRLAWFLRDQNQFLEQEVALRTRHVQALQDVTIHALATLAESRDHETGHHLLRTQHYVRLLAERLATHARFRELQSREAVDLLFKSAPLHDIGKVGIPDSILLRGGRLTNAEYKVMKTHTTVGRDAIARAERDLGVQVHFLRYAKEIAYSHHERWDGSGYPQGLSGNDIPISARLMAVADVYDALISERPYKSAIAPEEAIVMMAEWRDSHFDPDVFDALYKLQHDFAIIAEHFQGPSAEGECLP